MITLRRQAGEKAKGESMSVNETLCDRCDKPVNFDNGGGNCPLCEDNLCNACAGWGDIEWGDHTYMDGVCCDCRNPPLRLRWTKKPPTDKDVGRWFVYRHRDFRVPRISELLFSRNVDRKLVLESVELWKFVEQGYEFYGPLPY